MDGIVQYSLETLHILLKTDTIRSIISVLECISDCVIRYTIGFHICFMLPLLDIVNSTLQLINNC